MPYLGIEEETFDADDDALNTSDDDRATFNTIAVAAAVVGGAWIVCVIAIVVGQLRGKLPTIRRRPHHGIHIESIESQQQPGDYGAGSTQLRLPVAADDIADDDSDSSDAIGLADSIHAVDIADHIQSLPRAHESSEGRHADSSHADGSLATTNTTNTTPEAAAITTPNTRAASPEIYDVSPSKVRRAVPDTTVYDVDVAQIVLLESGIAQRRPENAKIHMQRVDSQEMRT